MAPCIFEDNFDLLVVLNRLGSRTDFLKELTKSKIWFALGRKEIFWGPFTCTPKTRFNDFCGQTPFGP